MTDNLNMLFISGLLFSVLVGCQKSDNGGPGAITLQQKINAVTYTAQNSEACTAIMPFYWEIGDSTGVLGSGAEGDGSIQGSTVIPIASGSKWLFGAYVTERKFGNLSASDIKFLTMSSGYKNFTLLSCSSLSVLTIDDCAGLGSNSIQTPAMDGKFFYNGGHYQKWAVDNMLGPFTRSDLASEYEALLGADVSLIFGSPQMAGGVSMSGVAYGKFLRKIVKKELLISSKLGSSAVCTLPSVCPTSASSPLSEKFHYSIGHWVEDDPVTGDGAFSSPGLFGFYPWIDSTKTTYGVISRYALTQSGNEIGLGYGSLLCGRAMRKAFVSGYAN